MNAIHSQQALDPGTMVQEYRVDRVLGMGSLGIVYAAENTYFNEEVAQQRGVARAGRPRMVQAGAQRVQVGVRVRKQGQLHAAHDARPGLPLACGKSVE